MVDLLEGNSKKRQKTDRFDPQGGLTNLNYHPGILDLDEPKIGGHQLVIQFKDNDGNQVGVQISVDSLSSKQDLNKMLSEFINQE